MKYESYLFLGLFDFAHPSGQAIASKVPTRSFWLIPPPHRLRSPLDQGSSVLSCRVLCSVMQPSAIAESIGALLEEAHIKLSSLVFDRLGASAPRMLEDWALPPRCEAAISTTRVSENTKQKRNFKSELHGEIPPRISNVQRCAQLLSDRHWSLSETRLETTSNFHSGFQPIRVLRFREGATSVVP
jgi:hypothetical protein